MVESHEDIATILEEALHAYRAGYFRSAVHAAYDAVHCACECTEYVNITNGRSLSGERTHWTDDFIDDDDSEVSFGERTCAIVAFSKMPQFLANEMWPLARLRNNMAHGRFVAPDDRRARLSVSAAALFVSGLGIVSEELAEFLSDLESDDVGTRALLANSPYTGSSVGWDDCTVTILEEAAAAHEAGFLRSAVHAAYDAVHCVCEFGFHETYDTKRLNNHYGDDYTHGYRGKYKPTFADRVLGVAREAHLSERLLSEAHFISRLRNDVAHGTYVQPDDAQTRRALLAAILFVDGLGVELSEVLTKLIAPLEEEESGNDDVRLCHEVLEPIVLRNYTLDHVALKMVAPTDWQVCESPRGVTFSRTTDILRIDVTPNDALKDLESVIIERAREVCKTIDHVNRVTVGDYERKWQTVKGRSDRKFPAGHCSLLTSQFDPGGCVHVEFVASSALRFHATWAPLIAAVLPTIEMGEPEKFSREAAVEAIAEQEFEPSDRARSTLAVDRSAEGIDLPVKDADAIRTNIVVKDWRVNGRIVALGVVLEPGTVTPELLRTDDYCSLVADSSRVSYYVFGKYAREAKSLIEASRWRCRVYSYRFVSGALKIIPL